MQGNLKAAPCLQELLVPGQVLLCSGCPKLSLLAQTALLCCGFHLYAWLLLDSHIGLHAVGLVFFQVGASILSMAQLSQRLQDGGRVAPQRARLHAT